MLTAADRQQGFFDAAWCADLLSANSIYALLAEYGDRIVRDEDFAECYSASYRRPSIPPSVRRNRRSATGSAAVCRSCDQGHSATSSCMSGTEPPPTRLGEYGEPN